MEQEPCCIPRVYLGVPPLCSVLSLGNLGVVLRVAILGSCPLRQAATYVLRRKYCCRDL